MVALLDVDRCVFRYPQAEEITIDVRVLVFTLAISTSYRDRVWACARLTNLEKSL
jgi:hypothetical protein